MNTTEGTMRLTEEEQASINATIGTAVGTWFPSTPRADIVFTVDQWLELRQLAYDEIPYPLNAVERGFVDRVIADQTVPF